MWRALPVLGAPNDPSVEDESVAPVTRLAEEAAAFLRDVLEAEGPLVSGVGEGQEIHLRGQRIVGHALVWDDAVVHLSAFPV